MGFAPGTTAGTSVWIWAARGALDMASNETVSENTNAPARLFFIPSIPSYQTKLTIVTAVPEQQGERQCSKLIRREVQWYSGVSIGNTL